MIGAEPKKIVPIYPYSHFKICVKGVFSCSGGFMPAMFFKGIQSPIALTERRYGSFA